MRTGAVVFIFFARLASACGGGPRPQAATPTAAPPQATAPKRACAEARLARLDRALADEGGSVAVLQGVVEACEVPPALMRSLERWATQPRGSALTPVIVAEDPSLWDRACTGGAGVFFRAIDDQASTDFGPREHAASLWSGCKMDAFGVATAEEWSRARNGELALLVRAVLVDAGVSSERIRAYVRALAELDRPREPSLAERYPAAAAPTPKFEGGVVGPDAGRPVTVEIALAASHGKRTVAQSYADTVARSASSFATCFADRSAPRQFVLELKIADGVAQDGELQLRKTTAPNRTEISPLPASASFHACVLSRAGALRFEPHAAPTTVDVDIRATAP